MKLKFGFFGIGLITAFIMARGSLAAETLDWEKILKEANNKNPALISARQSLKAAKISYRSSFTSFFPGISGNVGWEKSGPSGGGDNDFYGVYGRLSIPLGIAGFKDSENVGQKRIGLEIEEAKLRTSVAGTIYNIRIAFAGALRAEKNVSLTEEILKRRKLNRELVKLKYEAGREDKGAYLRTEADYSQSQYEYRKAERALNRAKKNLLKEIGRDDFGNFENIIITGTLKVVSLPPEVSFEELLFKSPEFQVAGFECDLAAHNLKFKKAALFPEVSLTGSASETGSLSESDGTQWSAGAEMSYSFLSAGKDVYNRQLSKISAYKADENFRATRQKLLYQYQKLWDELTDAAEGLKVREKYYAASVERGRIIRAKYINGLVSYQDWDSVEKELINSQKSLLSSEYGVFTALAAWKRLLAEGEK